MTPALSFLLLALTTSPSATEPQGRYKKAPDAEMWAQLMAIGYLDGVEEAGLRSGVTVTTPQAFQGLNLYASGHGPEAILMDMEGQVLHRWSYPYAEAFGVPAHTAAEFDWWRRVHLLEDGSLLAIYEGKGMVKLDRDSQLVWAHKGREHHDMEVLEDGTIVTLTRKPRPHGESWRADDHLAWLSPEGELMRELSLLDVIGRSELAQHYIDEPDVLHTNSVRVLDGSVDHPAFREGNILLSFRHLDALAVVDPEAEEVVWTARPGLIGPHDPTVLDERTLLVFDNRPPALNGGRGERASRVVEVDVQTGRIGWSYQAQPATAFFSATCGASQRLPNGNTLITESDAGRALEVDPSGRLVWEFVSPHRAESDPTLIATLQEVERLGDTPGWLRAK